MFLSFSLPLVLFESGLGHPAQIVQLIWVELFKVSTALIELTAAPNLLYQKGAQMVRNLRGLLVGKQQIGNEGVLFLWVHTGLPQHLFQCSVESFKCSISLRVVWRHFNVSNLGLL